MLSSVRIGLNRIVGDRDGFMLVLGDQPSLSCRVVDGLIQFWEKDSRYIVRPRFQEANGHPLIVPWEFVPEVMTHHDDTGLKGLLRQHPERVRAWVVGDEGVVRDIDTPADYERELQRVGSIGEAESPD